MLHKILFVSGLAGGTGNQSSMRNIPVAGKRQSAMPFVFEFAPFYFTHGDRQIRMLTLQGLNTGHFIHTFCAMTLFCPFRSLLIRLVNIIHLVIKIHFISRRQPIATQGRPEIFFTILRFITSSAISRAVHWLSGLPDLSGFSQARASILQRWSAVIRLGAPGRGLSSKRSSMLKSS